MRTLELTRLDEFSALQKVAAFATLVATYHEGASEFSSSLVRSGEEADSDSPPCRRTGFRLLLEPFETDNATVPNPVFHLVCLDASLAIAPVFERFSSVVITSGTLSPLDMYPKMLRFEATVLESYVMTLTRDCFLPLVRAFPFLFLLPSLGQRDEADARRPIGPHRLSLEAQTKSRSPPASKSVTTPPSSATSEPSSSTTARPFRTASLLSSRVTSTWRASLVLGTRWCVGSLSLPLLSFHSLEREPD